MPMTLLDILAALLTVSALFGALNARVFHLPHTVGLVGLGLVASLAISALDAAAPTLALGPFVRGVLASIDFRALLLDGFLSALLFAGAVHVDLAEVAQRKWAVATLATVGVLISTAVTGLATYAAARAFGLDLPLIWALALSPLSPQPAMHSATPRLTTSSPLNHPWGERGEASAAAQRVRRGVPVTRSNGFMDILCVGNDMSNPAASTGSPKAR